MLTVNAEPLSSWRRIVPYSDLTLLRALVVTSGICASIVFVVVGPGYELQLYADGSIFSYAVAVRDSWAFHWHNISGRLFVYLFCVIPAEAVTRLTGDARSGVDAYGFLFYVAQLLGLVATFVVDRSRGRIIFAYACFSTACLCPLVFGFPTEMWMAHAISWPALTICYSARGGVGSTIAIFAVLLALVFTHAGALLFVAAIMATLLLQGLRDPAFLRAAIILVAVMAIWAVVTTTLRPDDYFAEALIRIALSVFSLSALTSGLTLLIVGALAGYGIIFFVLRRWTPDEAHIYAALIVAAALTAYWIWLDQTLHADNRYYLRGALIIVTPMLGTMAALQAMDADGLLQKSLPFVPQVMRELTHRAAARAIAGAFLLLMLIHVVETIKFISAWTGYKDGVRRLATGTASDPQLGDPRLVSSDRLGAKLSRLAWFSTTPFLSVLVTPDLAPARLVVDPDNEYFWFSCEAATTNASADRPVPRESRELVRMYTCLHR